MAEAHSEDSPLLGAVDPPSPGESSPSAGPRDSTPTWSRPYAQDDTQWPEEPFGDPTERLHVPSAGGSPKLVHSQTSMDSGCDCDPSDGTDNSTVEACSIQSSSPNEGVIKPLRGCSPLSPSQPGPSGSATTGLVAPPAQKESLECHCNASDQKCFCDTSVIEGRLAPLRGELEPTHTDRGELSPSASRVTFRIEGYDDDAEEENIVDARLGSNNAQICHGESASQSGSEPGDDFKDLVRGAPRPFIKVSSYVMRTGMLSASSSTASMPMCRICHLPQGEGLDILISPCRCSGTMQFIHESCLMKWLEISSKRIKKAPACELCNYQFNRHKKFRLRHWKLPTCSRIDKILHSVFLLCLIVMATSATITVYSFKQDRFNRKRDDVDLTRSEIVTLTCGVLFFVAFFMAMYVEVKAKDTLYRLFARFLYLNQTWHIDEYDKGRDSQMVHEPV